MSSFSACCCCFHWAFFRGRGLISGCPLKWCAHLTGKFTNSKARRKSCPDASRKNSFCYCWLQMPFFSIVCVCVCMRCITSFFSISLKIDPLKGDSAASVCDSPAWIMKPQETYIQSLELNHLTFPLFFFSLSLSHTHTHKGDTQSEIGVKSLDLRPLFGPMRTSSTPGCNPIGRL